MPPSWSGSGGTGPRRGHRPRTRHRRAAAGLRRRPLRGLRGQDLPRAERRGARPLPRRQRRRRPRRGRGRRRARCRARQPPDHGPGDPGAGRPRSSRPRCTAPTSPTPCGRTRSASFPTPARAPTPPAGCWSAPGTPPRTCGRPSAIRVSRPDPAGAARRGRRGLSLRRRRRRPCRSVARGWPSGSRTSPQTGLLQPRRARRGDGAAGVGRGVAPGALRRQAARQQGACDLPWWRRHLAPGCCWSASATTAGLERLSRSARRSRRRAIAAAGAPGGARSRGARSSCRRPRTPMLPAAAARALAGRLEHAEVAEVMPAAEAFVMPSTFPEAFGMVAAEAAACGVPPVSADHSGMREVSRQLAEAVGPGAGAHRCSRSSRSRRRARRGDRRADQRLAGALGRRARAGRGGAGRAGRRALELAAGRRGRDRRLRGSSTRCRGSPMTDASRGSRARRA